MLEVGPGYGATTEVLSSRVEQLTCVEIDAKLVEVLRRRMLKQNVTVLCEDATAMSLPDGRFDGAVCFTMLHHIPSVQLQDRLLREVWRVLRPGCVFAGTDSLDSRFFRLLHFPGTPVVIKPDAFAHRLEAAGFEDVEVNVNPYAFRFRARKPLSA